MGYKIKRILVGDKQVRPAVYEYSYDFRNKNYNTVVNDGWFLRSGTSQSNIQFNSSRGIYSQSWGGMGYNIGSDKIANAKKVTITCGFYLESPSQLGANLYSSTSRGNPSMGSYVYNVGNELNLSLGNETKKGGMTSSGELQWTAVYDLINKTAVLNYTQGSSVSISGTLTDSSIASIRGGCNYLGFIAGQAGGMGYLTTIYVKIE